MDRLKIFCLNIRSVRANFDELVLYLNSVEHSYEIIVLTEVWIKDGEEGRYQLPGYNILLQPRLDNQAGGVAIYLDRGLRYTHSLIALPSAEIINVILQVNCNNIPTLISLFAIYRNCKFSYNYFKNDFENILKLTSDPTIIVGDLNVCTIKYNGSGRDYLNTIAAYGFENQINTPTRILGNSVSCLDHVLVRNSKNIQITSEVITLDITDHYALSVSVGNIIKQPIKCKYKKVIDYNMLRRQLLHADWNPVLNTYEINSCISQFYKIYNECHISASSLKTINSKNKKRNNWISDGLVKFINRKNELFVLYSKDRNNLLLKTEYQTLSKEVKREIKIHKYNYYSSLIERCNGDSRKYWKTIKSLIKHKKDRMNVIKIGNLFMTVADNEYRIANYFNNYFSNIVSTLKDDAFGNDLFFDQEVDNNMIINKTEFFVTHNDIESCIRTMKNKKSCGLDDINILTIKRNIDVFTPLLYDIYKKSLQQGVVPDSFKTACVVPVYKTGDNREVSSYRPISLISTLAKIFESIIKENLLRYLNDERFFSDNQFGFLPGRGTDLALYKHINSISNSVDKHMYTLAIYLDFQKAFDVLDIDILLKKIRKAGIGGKAYNWLHSFAKERKQVVRINGICSDMQTLRFGTAQGGVLGPVMFLIYINDLLNIQYNSSIFAYADDTALVCSAYNREVLKSKINQDLNIISQWLIENKLLINSTKSKCLMFFDMQIPKQELTNIYRLMCHKHLCIYQCACSSIEVVDCVKYLGMYLDEHLKWDHHINYLNGKLRRINYSLYYLKNYINHEYLKNVYSSWFESTVRYGIIHYGATYPTLLQPIIMNQRNAIRNVYNLRKTDPVSQIFISNNIFNFYQLHHSSIINFVHKYLHMFPVKSFVRATRSSHNIALQIPNFQKEKCRHQCCYVGPKLFNIFIMHYGNEILNERKPKFKMKNKDFVLNRPYQAV